MRLAFLIFTSVFALVACSKGGSTRSGGGSNPDTSKVDGGGVDVGNMTSAFVPKTYASMSYPASWSGNANADVLSIQNKSGSVIAAKKAEITDLTSPNAVSLQQYMKAKYPNRTYKIINVNGLEGVRADVIDTESQKQSDIYLVSELKDFIHIESDLKKADNGIVSGDQIILTARVEYKGVAFPNPQPKTVTLTSYGDRSGEYMKAAYTFSSDCYSYVDSGCRGVSVLYGNGNGMRLDVGNGGYDHGRIIELGPESETPFDEIKIDGKYLVAPISKVPLADIYTAFTPKDPKQEQDSISLKAGYVYLVRTISWPEEDIIVKMRVEKAGSSLTLTYSKLAYVEPAELKKQVDIINKYTIENEQPLSTGEVTLYNRSAYNSYFYAAFNFEFSTSGNMFITHNNWDLLFEGSAKEPGLACPHAGSSIGQVVDVGTKKLEDISLTDFPDPNTYSYRSTRAVVGHTYIVYRYNYDGKVTYGAVHVLELGPDSRWVRLKFRRIGFDTAGYFQKWVDLAVPSGVQSVTLEAGGNSSKARFYPFINKRGDQGSHYYEDMDLSAYPDNPDYLRVDSRPYGDKRGFFKLGNGISLDNVTQAQVEALRGKFVNRAEFQKGDVYAVLLENYYDKTVMVMRIDSAVPDKSVQLSFKYLYRGKAVYSDDKE